MDFYTNKYGNYITVYHIPHNTSTQQFSDAVMKKNLTTYNIDLLTNMKEEEIFQLSLVDEYILTAIQYLNTRA